MASSSRYHNSTPFGTEQALHFGSSHSPVIVLPDATFRCNHNEGGTSIFNRLNQQLRTKHIHGIGLCFTPVTVKIQRSFVRWLDASDDDEGENIMMWSDIPPGSYPLRWGQERRDLMATLTSGCSKIGRVTSAQNQHPLMSSLNTFIQLLLARLWDDPFTDRCQFRYARSEVVSCGCFVVVLEPLLGHRDFIRVLSMNNEPPFVDMDTSLFVDDYASVAFNNGFDPELDDADDSNRVPRTEPTATPWFPWSGAKTTLTTTYIVVPAELPFGNTTSPNIENSEMVGIYVSATVDIEAASTRLPTTDRQHHLNFEYVKPVSYGSAETFRQFFVPLWNAICLPTYVAVRFTSHAKYKLCVIATVHYYRPTNVVDEDGEVETRKKENIPSVSRTSYPFTKSFVCSVTQNQISGELFCDERNNTVLHKVRVGTIPVYKTIENEVLRRAIWNKVEERDGSHSKDWAIEQSGTPAVIWKSPHFPGESHNYYSYLSFTEGKRCLTVNNLPILDIQQFLHNNDSLNSTPFNTRALVNFEARRRPRHVESDSE